MSHSTPLAWALLLSMATAAAFAGDSPKSDAAAKKKELLSRISSKVDVHPVAVLSDNESGEVSFAAGRILKHIAQARDAIRENKQDDAARHVEQGLKLVAIIDHVLPHFKVKTEIKSGDKAYSDEDDVSPRYVMLFDELERRDIISPITQARKEVQQKQPKNHGTQAPVSAATGALAVSHVDIHHTTAKVDIVLARHMLNRAKQFLHDGKFSEADEALLTVQSGGVLFEYEEIDLPLEEAADNLKLAEIEMAQGRHAEAGAALNVAIEQLKKYEKFAGENRGAEVKALHQEITKLTAELDKGNISEADQQKHASKISEWWHRSAKWFKNKAK